MRLKSIKLAGFKSFVDPTTVHFPSNLCGIVGPNGCGKSNIIDAVRWVMGESSAKNLRGEHMADVIFNGSSARKPVAQASIELVFDNHDTMLTGEMAKYNEISIRRKLIRDGTSFYYLNGTKCRRRDITDIFLGTGLGPRSYAIIEQGMISRLIDAKPEELRVYVEEAAGISKYKERRRETENRMRRTQENLERLNDIREELGRQLQTLKRQSESAVKYKQFKQEERLAKAELQSMQWRALDSEANAKESVIGERQNALEACIARQHGIDTDIEKARVRQAEHTEIFNGVQGRFYSVGADIARIEQTLQHQQERRQQLTGDLQQTEGSTVEIDSHLGDDQSKLEAWEAELQMADPKTVELQRAEQAAASALQTADQDMHDWQAQWDEFNSAAAQASQAAEVQQSRIQHIEQAQETLQQRITRLEQEKVNLADGPQESDLSTLGSKLAALELQNQQLESGRQDLGSRIEQQRSELQQKIDALDKVRSELQSMRGRQASLEALQQAALGQNDSATHSWLQGHSLQEKARLGEELQVDPGWEVAVETVLGNYLQAVHVDNLDGFAPELATLEVGTVTLMSGSGPIAGDSEVATSLASRVSAPVDLRGLLHGIKVADDINTALAMRASLQTGESVITPDGIWLAPNWLRVARDNDAQAGILHRQAELQELTEQIVSRETVESVLQQQLEHSREAVVNLEHQLDS
ncbi:MAG: chromosome segregation protein SMC, partial [Pseudomonadales bacterium]